MGAKNLVPYSLYLPADIHARLKEAAKSRKASVLVRDAITMIIEGNEAYTSGYNKGIKDAAQLVYDCEEAQMVAIKGKDLGSILTERIESLEIKK
jgi:hypothetical protein